MPWSMLITMREYYARDGFEMMAPGLRAGLADYSGD